MSEHEQRWLSLTGISIVLEMTERHVLWLAKKGYLVSMPGKSRVDTRYLDPTPEYANKLRLSEALYGRQHPLPRNFDMTPLLTIREVAQILGLTVKAAKNAATKKRIPGGVKVGQYTLYPVSVIRERLWKKQGRSQSKQRSPFLIEELVRFFLAHQAEEANVVPSDADFMSDEVLAKKFARMSRLPLAERQVAMRDLWDKIELAKKVSTALTA